MRTSDHVFAYCSTPPCVSSRRSFAARLPPSLPVRSEEVLYIILDRKPPPWMAQAQQSVISLLELSEELARHVQVSRYTMGKGQPQGEGLVPYEAMLRARSEVVQFH